MRVSPEPIPCLSLGDLPNRAAAAALAVADTRAPTGADVDLVKYAFPEDIWFHVGQNTSSAHLYLRTQGWMGSWDKLPEALVMDVAQLTKANSIEGNK